jgi:hypothetical protein
MVVPALTGMVVLLIPVVAIEGWYVSRQLKLARFTIWATISVANVLSTLFGVPLAVWAHGALRSRLAPYGGTVEQASFRGEFWSDLLGVVCNSAWLPPRDGQMYWMVPVALLVLLAPCYLASVLMELFVCMAAWADSIPKARVLRLVVAANLRSSCFLCCVVLLLLAHAVWSHAA